ncbi:type VI secretion system tip protein TssI/VgrG [Acinetobacter gerneri]|uniref:type VI secretion system Vgr family protein n=1 Tax=Acinetobacter gerneri TaxID=202952 RepID=UPI0029356E11|nr:type VI secretion system tip protein TssI/VgrG [Acinetobacter gerneri]MDV2439342.1 type VI secretion system tip protein TssI/VgrG [Acinetobacter gerneri]
MNHQIKLFGKALPESEYGTPYFWFDSLSGSDKINELFEYQLVVKVRDEFHNPAHGYAGLEGYVPKQLAQNGGSPASDLNLQSLIGTEIAVAVRLDGLKPDFSGLGNINDISGDSTYQSNLNGTRYFRGLVNRVEALAVRNRHAMYKLTLVPWVWLLTKTSNYRIFQHKTVLQIIEEVLQPYPYPVDYRCSQSYAALDFQAQYGEDDYSFIHRLMQEHGINFHFEHSQNQLTFVISDHNAAYKEMEATGYRNLSIYPPNQRFPDTAEYIEHFEPVQQLVSGKVQLSDYQFKQPSLVQSAQDQFLWDHDYAEQEIYEWQQGDFLSADEGGQNKAKSRVEGLYQHGYRAEGQGKLKGLQTGYRFNLDNHPNSESNRGWLVLGTQITIQDISQEKADNQFYDSNVRFLAQPDEQILRPDLTRNKPQGRPQTATVVGPAGEEIYTDQYGRVKVKFHWDRLGAQAQEEGADTGDGTNTCWLRVSTAWAGNNFGTIHLPRIGQEVIVDFFNGDPDMPFVSGRLTNPEQMPVWELPSQKALSGIKSKELGGSQANQLVMDDSKGQVQVHLRSDHQASELNLGYITRIPDPKGRKDFRGEGFELRTDGHGVIRAGQGLILSTYAKANAESYAKSIKETVEQLTNSVDIHKLQTQAAITHKVDERSIDQTAQAKLIEQLQSIKGQEQKKFPELSDPQIVIGASSGVAIVSEKSTHLSSKEHIALTTKKDISLVSENNLFASVAKGITLFAQNLGARLFTAKGKIEIEAQSDDIEIIADQNIKMLSLKKKIELVAAEEIILNVNGNYIKIDKNGIEQGTQNNWVVHANNHEFQSAKTLSYVLPAFKGTNDEAFRILDDHGNALTGFKYKIVIGDNEQVFRGETDENGFTSRINSGFDSKKVTIYQDVDDESKEESETGEE